MISDPSTDEKDVRRLTRDWDVYADLSNIDLSLESLGLAGIRCED
jgi:hypothetical protein